MKTKEGNNYYLQDLNCYTNEFLIEIILHQQESIKELFGGKE